MTTLSFISHVPSVYLFGINCLWIYFSLILFLPPKNKYIGRYIASVITLFTPAWYIFYLDRPLYVSIFHAPFVLGKIYFPYFYYFLTWGAIVLPVVFVAAIGIRLSFRPFFSLAKKALHGPRFFPTDTPLNEGVRVGDYSRAILPITVQKFAKDLTEPLVIPYNRLSRTVSIIGDQGCGKSRLMRAVADDIVRVYPDIPVLIHDPKGEWLRSYYDPSRDLIFSPYDNRSCAWSLWADFLKHPDLKHAIISAAVESHYSAASNDRFWSDSAVSLLEDVTNAPTLDDAKKQLLIKLSQNEDNRTFLSVYETAKIAFKDLAAIELMGRTASHSLSIDEFLSHKGKIFLLNNPKISALQHSALSILLTAFLLETLSLQDLPEGTLRAAAVIDEALSFHLPPQIENAIYSQCRSKGLTILTSAQWLPKRPEGQRGAWAVQSGHIFCMRVTDLETRNAFSQRTGSIRFEDEQKSKSSGKNNSSTTTATVERHYAALPPECFGSLKDRDFILFHSKGVAPGITIDVTYEQNDSIPVSLFSDRQDITLFMRGI